MLSDPMGDSGTCLRKEEACGLSVSKYKHSVWGRTSDTPHANMIGPVFFLLISHLSEQAKFLTLLYHFLDPSANTVM